MLGFFLQLPNQKLLLNSQYKVNLKGLYFMTSPHRRRWNQTMTLSLCQESFFPLIKTKWGNVHCTSAWLWSTALLHMHLSGSLWLRNSPHTLALISLASPSATHSLCYADVVSSVLIITMFIYYWQLLQAIFCYSLWHFGTIKFKLSLLLCTDLLYSKRIKAELNKLLLIL